MKSLALALLLLAPSALAGDDAHLAPGMPAPALKDVKWIKGDAVAAWQPGKVYVLDFWATWCGPCKASIPHIDELYDTRHKDGVNVIGVAIWPRKGMVPTADFVKDKGDAMSYDICEDLPDGDDAGNGKTSKAFMMAAGQNGIPTCMVIDKTGHVAWIGHPLDGLEKVVDDVLADKWDAAAYAHKFNLKHDLQEAGQAGDWPKVADLAGELFKLDPKGSGEAGLQRYDALLRTGKADDAAKWGRELVASGYKDDSQALNSMAWMIVDPQEPRDKPDIELARAAADAANAITKGEDFSVLDTLARVVYLQGDVARAIDLQQKAIDKAPAEAKDELGTRLKEYQAAKH